LQREKGAGYRISSENLSVAYLDVLRGQRDDEERALVRERGRGHDSSTTTTATMTTEKEHASARVARRRCGLCFYC